MALSRDVEDGFEVPPCQFRGQRQVSQPVTSRYACPRTGLATHIVLLDDLVEASIVELDELGEVVDVGNDVAQVLLEQDELLLAGAVLAEAALVEAVDDIADLALADL